MFLGNFLSSSESGELYIHGKDTHNLRDGLLLLAANLKTRNLQVFQVHFSNESAVVLAIPMLPKWSALKPVLVGWSKEIECCYHHTKGVPLHILQYIVELAWECELPYPLYLPGM